MSTLKFTATAAKDLETFYKTRDLAAQRAFTLHKLAIQPGAQVIDIGCGPGFLSEDLATLSGPDGTVTGIDISPDLIALCENRVPAETLTYQVANAKALPFPDAHFDVAACTQVFEYIHDCDKVISEIYRVLRPGGRAVIVATDWDTLGWHSTDPNRMAQILRGWEAHCAYPRLPRQLGFRLRKAGFDLHDVDMFPIVNTGFGPDDYSFGIAKLMHTFVVKGRHVPSVLADDWFAELIQLDAEGSYYFTTGRMVFTALKPAEATG